MYKNISNKKELQPFRTYLRTHSTQAECVLWRLLKNSQVGDLKFRRQHSIGNYIVDFYCSSLKLAIELDGEIHNDLVVHMRDEGKEEFLNEKGITVLRFPNETVFRNPEYIKQEILQFKESCNGITKTTTTPQAP